MFQGTINITNCYDSHVHWLATGEAAFRLDLRELMSAESVDELEVTSNHYCEDWLMGFGWDQHKWLKPTLPTRHILDQVFGAKPVVFARADGHALWLSTEALKRAGLFYKNPTGPEGGQIVLGDDLLPAGVVYENAADAVRKVIPSINAQQMRSRLLSGAQTFNQAGFTHIRDMGGSSEQWSAMRSLEDTNELSLCVNQFFVVDAKKSFHQALREALLARKDQGSLTRAMGVKVFLDGSLGSETAFLSQSYSSGSGHGLCLLERFTLKEIMIETWSAGLELAVHAIGDEAFHMLAQLARELWDRGEIGVLHIEHGQLARPESIALLDPLQTQIHMQPCHWLTDKLWLKEKVGSLFAHAFPWRAFEKASLPVFFGSDSPIESSSFIHNLKAVKDAAQNGITKFEQDFAIFHSLPALQSKAHGKTVFKDGRIESVSFNDRIIFQTH